MEGRPRASARRPDRGDGVHRWRPDRVGRARTVDVGGSASDDDGHTIDQVARVEALYDAAVLHAAADPTVPSVTDAVFDVTRWQAFNVDGTSARAVVVGHFRLHEPGNLAARAVGGYVTVFDRTWTVAATFTDGRWRMEGRSAA